MAEKQVKYWAISIFSSRTFWFNAANFIVAVLSLTEVLAIIPPDWMSTQAAVVAMINVWLRMVTKRPAAVISPGTTKEIALPKLDPPATKAVTD